MLTRSLHGTAGGQFFNLFNFGRNPNDMKDLQTKELKNGARRCACAAAALRARARRPVSSG